LIRRSGVRLTKRELNQLKSLREEIQDKERQLRKLEEKSPVGVPKLTGTPSGRVVRKKVEDEAIEKTAIRDIISRLKKKAAKQELEIWKFIESVDDSFVRRIIEYKYIDLLTWRQVSYKIYGRYDRESTCRMILDNYLAKK
jgi:hypothetical protein